MVRICQNQTLWVTLKIGNTPTSTIMFKFTWYNGILLFRRIKTSGWVAKSCRLTGSPADFELAICHETKSQGVKRKPSAANVLIEDWLFHLQPV